MTHCHTGDTMLRTTFQVRPDDVERGGAAVGAFQFRVQLDCVAQLEQLSEALTRLSQVKPLDRVRRVHALAD